MRSYPCIPGALPVSSGGEASKMVNDKSDLIAYPDILVVDLSLLQVLNLSRLYIRNLSLLHVGNLSRNTRLEQVRTLY